MQYLQYVAFLVATAGVALAADSPKQLKDVKAIYVAPMEGRDVAVTEMLQAKLISALTRIQAISIVEDEENADAILTGSGLIQTAIGESGRTHYLIQGGMRLISKEGGIVLWADNMTSSRFARSASSSFADNLGKSLAQLFADRQKR